MSMICFTTFLIHFSVFRTGAKDEVAVVPIELRNDFAHCLGGTGGSWNDVLVGTTAITPGLGAGPVHGLLGGCVGVDRSLQGAELFSVKHKHLKGSRNKLYEQQLP